jgi:hypothetical protein
LECGPGFDLTGFSIASVLFLFLFYFGVSGLIQVGVLGWSAGGVGGVFLASCWGGCCFIWWAVTWSWVFIR